MPEFSLATAPSTAQHRQLALAVIVVTLLAYALVIPFASIELPRVDSFVPTLFAIVFVADLVTAVLLFAQFAAAGSRPLLVLACGYLFSSLIVVAHALTYAGAFSPTGLLGAGPQTAPWLNILWRSGLSVFFGAYAVLKVERETESAIPWPRSAILWGVAIVIALVGSLIFIVTAWHDFLPALLSNGSITLVGRYACTAAVASNLTALILLARTRGKFILDVWLIVAATALAAESLMILFVIHKRYEFSFYAIRLIALPVSKVVLIALMWETMRLYANLAVSLRDLQRERESRLTNVATIVAAIAHEIRQPLVGINLLAGAAQRSLEQAAPHGSSAKKQLGEIAAAALHANEVFDNFLKLIRAGKRDLQMVDANALMHEAVRMLEKNLREHNVTITMKLASDLPLFEAHKGQLREIVLNLIQNAIEAMAPIPGSPRAITITTSRRGSRDIALSVHDTGPGIAPDQITNIFDPFVTTKSEGTGLGLAICRMIVDSHGGQLLAENDEAGGALFTIELPIGTPPSAAPPETPRSRPAPLTQITALFLGSGSHR